MADMNSTATRPTKAARRVATKPGSQAREGPPLHVSALAAPFPLPTLAHAPKRPIRKAPVMAALPASRAHDGALSFRRELADHERAVIDAAFTILGCYLREPGGAFATPGAVSQYLRLHLAGESCELFAVLYLDAQHRAIALETPFAGTLTQCSVYPREIVRAALVHGAASIVLAHNHPSGTPTPSHADAAITETLKNALALVDVRLLDHFIIAGGQAVSMVELGLM